MSKSESRAMELLRECRKELSGFNAIHGACRKDELVTEIARFCSLAAEQPQAAQERPMAQITQRLNSVARELTALDRCFDLPVGTYLYAAPVAQQEPAQPIARAIEAALTAGYTPQEILDENSPTRDEIRNAAPVARDRNMEGAEELVTAIIMDLPMWPNKWGQDVAAAAFFLTDRGSRPKWFEATRAQETPEPVAQPQEIRLALAIAHQVRLLYQVCSDPAAAQILDAADREVAAQPSQGSKRSET